MVNFLMEKIQSACWQVMTFFQFANPGFLSIGKVSVDLNISVEDGSDDWCSGVQQGREVVIGCPFLCRLTMAEDAG